MEKEFTGYELQSLVSHLRIRGMYEDADKLERDHRTNYLSSEAIQVVKEETE